MEKVTVVVPAYNEGRWISRVLKALVRAKNKGLITDIVVVDDGSSDNTARIASEFPVRLIKFKENKGKGAAIAAGIKAAKSEIVLLLDADLVGLKNHHIETLIKPIVDNPVIGMSVGLFRSSGWASDFGNMLLMLSGQRALRRSWAQNIPGLEESRYGADVLITRFARRHNQKILRVYLDKLNHVYKEQKHNFLVGFFKYRMKMYFEISKVVINDIKYRGSYVPSDTNEAYED